MLYFLFVFDYLLIYSKPPPVCVQQLGETAQQILSSGKYPLVLTDHNWSNVLCSLLPSPGVVAAAPGGRRRWCPLLSCLA